MAVVDRASTTRRSALPMRAFMLTRAIRRLGHLIFMLGLAITFCSAPPVLLLVFHVFWFQRRVLEDEAYLQSVFGEAYRGCHGRVGRVKRWIPCLIQA